MKFEPLPIPGAWRIIPSPATDNRGNFTRLIDAARFQEHGLESSFHQHAVSRSHKQGTLRGLHFQQAPHQEVKLIRCTQGRLWDVMVDLRTDSPTYLQHLAFTLDAAKPQLLYIPAGCAHGFITLTDNAEIEYHINQPYIETAQAGIRWNDPSLTINWPAEITTISERDKNFPNWSV